MWEKRIMKFDLNEKKKNHHETIAHGGPDFITI